MRLTRSSAPVGRQDPASSDPQRMAEIIALFESYPQKILSALPSICWQKGRGRRRNSRRGYLRNQDLVANHWCSGGCAELAFAWFPSLDSPKQQALLDLADAVPARYKATWSGASWNVAIGRRDAEDERRYQVAHDPRGSLAVARGVAACSARQALNSIEVRKIWRSGHLEGSLLGTKRSETPLTSADVLAEPVEATLAFISGWQPGEEPRAANPDGPGVWNCAVRRSRTRRNTPRRLAVLPVPSPGFIRHLFEGLARRLQK